MDIISRTFSVKHDTLPTCEEVRGCIIRLDNLGNRYAGNRSLPDQDLEFSESLFKAYSIRDEYTRHSFSILTHEFFLSVVKMVKDLKLDTVAELCCGGGWLSYWLGKYGVPAIKSVDDMSWEERFNKAPVEIITDDAEDFVLYNTDVKLFIMSWPDYTSEIAYKVWQAMLPGQYLLFIGESRGGCTAEDKFFNAVEDKDVPDAWGLSDCFLSFWGIHDRPTLYQK